MSNNKQSSVDKDFVPYAEALALKELGFDEPCFMSFNPNPNWWDNQCTNSQLNSLNGGSKIVCSSPLWQQAFRWFREKYGLYYFEDHRCNSKTDISSITYWMGIKKLKLAPFGSEVLVGIIELGCYNTYEEAELACLRKLIEIVKQGGNK